MAPEIISREEAIARGLPRYFTGEPCINGHVSERRTVTKGCYACYALAQKRWRSKNPDKVIQIAASWRARNPDKVRAMDKRRHRKHHAKRLAAMLEYRRKHLAKIKENNAAYRKEHREHARQKTALWRDADPERAKRSRNQSRARHPESARLLAKKRNALERGARGLHTVTDLRNILKRQKRRCAYCRRLLGKKYKASLDHIIALSKDGSNWPRNLQFTCMACNIKKSNRDPIEFSQSIGLLI